MDNDGTHPPVTPLLLPETPFNDMKRMGNDSILLQFMLQFGLLLGKYEGPWDFERWDKRWLLVHGDAIASFRCLDFIQMISFHNAIRLIRPKNFSNLICPMCQ
eukprot:scaffold122798_cov69-Attheya_sp.AAC.1